MRNISIAGELLPETLTDEKVKILVNKYYEFLKKNADEKFDKLMSKEDKTNPDHYKKYPIETIDQMIAIYGKEEVVIYCKLTAYKYRSRMGYKEGSSLEDDFAKEQWYLNKIKELENK